MNMFSRLWLRLKAVWIVLKSSSVIIFEVTNFGSALGGRNIALNAGPMEILTVAFSSREIAKSIIKSDGGLKAVKRKYNVDDDTDMARFMEDVVNG